MAEGEHTKLELEVAALKQHAANRSMVGGLSQLASADEQLALLVEKSMAEAGVHPPSQDIDDDGADEEEDDDDDLLE